MFVVPTETREGLGSSGTVTDGGKPVGDGNQIMLLWKNSQWQMFLHTEPFPAQKENLQYSMVKHCLPSTSSDQGLPVRLTVCLARESEIR